MKPGWVVRKRTKMLSYTVFLDLSRVHNVDYRDDPPVQEFVRVFLVLIGAGFDTEALLLPGFLMALGRSTDMQT